MADPDAHAPSPPTAAPVRSRRPRSLYQLHVRPFLGDLARERRRPCTLDDVPDALFASDVTEFAQPDALEGAFALVYEMAAEGSLLPETIGGS